ncbi:longitudinals lacking protein, isoforms H/M/V-like [Schistocerca piceifrons]|uniref:longitudinals lacking protein, isoforms H/M/V-like n=1 Tax=Schistocerca piceifrons TaxID=274613 RepID=UPI001F5FAD86|nr:longitudinals lacking protein, isoforms H/M/V-like [Schistocerca piceifrons]
MEQDTDVYLRWNNHQTTLLSIFSSLLDNGSLADCTISAEGQYFKAHRVILSACSPYFELLFSQHCEKHPIVILADVKFQILKALMEFIYSGEVKVPQNKLCTFLEIAETLQIKGLSFAGDSSMKNELRLRRMDESAIHSVEQIFTKHLFEPRHGSQMERKKDVSSSHDLELECFEDSDSHLLAAQKCDSDSSSYVSREKPVDEPALLQDISDTEAFNVFECSAVTKTHTKSNTSASGTLFNSVSNTLDSNELPGSSNDNTGEQGMLSENVLSVCSFGKELRTLESLGTCGERCGTDLLPEMKQKDAGDFNGNSIEEIVLDDDTDEGDNCDRGSGSDNCNTFGELVREIPKVSFSGQGFCSLEEKWELILSRSNVSITKSI